MTKATYTQPASVDMYVKSATHSRFGAGGAKLRPTRSSALGAAGSATVVRLTFAPGRAPQAQDAHEPLDGAAGHVVIILAQRQPDLPRAITRVILVISFLDELHEILVGDSAPRPRPPAGVVIRGRGKCAAQLGELGAHRLDPVPVLVLVDEPDDHRSGRSSSAAKKIEAAFSISFARRNSRFSARSLRTSADSSLVTPCREPESISARRIHFRKVSGVPMASFLATASIAAYSDG